MPQLKTKIEERIRELVPELNPCNCDNGHLFLGYGGEDNDEPEWGACPNCVIDGRYEPQYDDIHLEHILMAIQEKSLPKNGGVIFPEENQTDIPASKRPRSQQSGWCRLSVLVCRDECLSS